jgi:molecular chaperone HscA
VSGGLVQIAEPGAADRPHACAGRAIGIDLGTTYSLVATVRAGSPLCLPDEQGRTLLPSVVHFDADGPVRVGWDARAEAESHPLDTLFSVKRFMGRGQEDEDVRRRMGAYRFAESGPGVVRFLAGGRSLTPVEVSAEILRVLRRRAEAALGGPVDGAVITVPAYFDDAQRQATRDAGRLAGLSVLRLLNEPTAALLAYGLENRREGLFAVYDLGGGTFDVSILKLQEGVFEVKATAGDTALGGDDIDETLAARLLDGLEADAAALRRALDAARVAKERLTDAERTEVMGRTFTRADLERLAAPVVARTTAPCRRALADAGVAPGDLDGIVLVGGQTRMPVVRRHVAEIFGRTPLCDLDPDEVVALGAAVQADLLAGAGPRDDVLLLDVTPLSLGIETMGGVVEKIIPRNSTIPAGAHQVFTTFADGQTGIDVHVLQGEREIVDQCRSLARFQLKGIPPMAAGLARVEITFLVDADGILTVSAREQTTGVEQQVQVKPSYGLADDEVERMLLDSYEHAEEDLHERAVREQRVEAEQILRALDRALAEDHGLLEDGERDAIDRASAALREAAAAGDTDRMRACREHLDRAATCFAQRRMDAAIRRAMVGRTV